MTNNFPKLHNAMWPGLVGKGSPGAEPFIDLDTMLDLTARAEVNGVKFDGGVVTASGLSLPDCMPDCRLAMPSQESPTRPPNRSTMRGPPPL